ncbi:uncharacterized protein LOC142532848 [Primulina tabacum]|uniref:uncharacterized protein LOC142532848 n=1 Tax=Primulina tabacum TaxID=48773 RepID=UPI003F5A8D9D
MPKNMMNCRTQILNPRILHNICAKTTNLSPHFPTNPNPKLQKTTLFTAHNAVNQQQKAVSTISVNETEISNIDVINVKLKTLGGCKLGISRYPDFEYDAQGGSGTGKATVPVSNNSNDRLSGEVFVDFDVNTLYIPAVSTATTKFLRLPLPPFLNIHIVPEILSGKINTESGQVDLRLKAKFYFSVGSIYRAAPLVVDTVLTSEEATGDIRGGRGARLNEQGFCALVGVARVDPIGDLFMDSFLSLPSECLAYLQATISFVNK